MINHKNYSEAINCAESESYKLTIKQELYAHKTNEREKW